MTSCSGLDRIEEIPDLPVESLDEIASLWAVFVAMDDLPASAEGKDSLHRARERFKRELRAAHISEEQLAASIDRQLNDLQSLRKPPDLRVVRD
jgi:hypothetical protein